LDNLGISGLGAKSHLQAGSDGGLLRGRGARHDIALIEEIGKLDAARLESRSARVSQVVRDVIQIDLLGGHPAGSSIESVKH